jgi:hypothetical protein
MPRIVKYPLTPEAKDAARRIVDAWNTGVLPQTMLFGHYHQGKVSIPTFFDMGGNQINYDDAPERGVFFELAQFNMVIIRTFREGNTLEVILLQELRNAVATDFTVSEYFLTLNAAGVLNLGGTVHVVDGANHRLAPPTNGDRPITPAEIAEQLRTILGPQTEGLEDALWALETSDNPRSVALDLTAALGMLMEGDDDPSATRALTLLARSLRHWETE